MIFVFTHDIELIKCTMIGMLKISITVKLVYIITFSFNFVIII